MCKLPRQTFRACCCNNVLKWPTCYTNRKSTIPSLIITKAKGQALAKELLRNAALNYRLGEIDYTTLSQQVEQAIGIELSQLENLYGLSLTVVELKFIAGL